LLIEKILTMIEKGKKISIGCDHAGFCLKEIVKNNLGKKGYEIADFGTFSEESTDYPDYAHPVANAVEKGISDSGILICGSGNGVCITANKYPNVRAALCWNAEIASLARKHNNANIVCLPARFISAEQAQEIIETFINTEFEGGRHERRINKINL
jgi:ribose 5-phosphate isomerase B